MLMGLSGNFFKTPSVINEVIALILYVILFFLIIHNISKNSLKILFKIINFSGFLVILYGLIQLLGFDPFGWDTSRLEFSSVISTIGNPAFLAGFMVVLMPISFYLLLSENKRELKIFYLICFVLEIFMVLNSYTRACWIALFFVLAGLLSINFFQIKNKFKFKVVFFAILIGIFSFLLFMNIYSNGRLVNRFLSTFNPKEGNIAARLYLWKVSERILKENPMGIGPGNFVYFYAKNRFDEPLFLRQQNRLPLHPHNYLLEILINTGIVGFIAFLSIVITFFYLTFQEYKKRSSRENGTILLCSMWGVIGFFLTTAFLFPTIETNILFFLFLAVPCIYNKTEPENIPKERAYKPGLGTMAIIATLFIVVFFASFNITKNILADYYLEKGEIFQEQNNNLKAVKEFERAISFNKQSAAYYQFYGKFSEDLFFKTGDINFLIKAAENYEKSRNLNTDDPTIFADLGRSLAELATYSKNNKFKIYDYSISSYREAIERDPYNPFWHADLGYVFEQKGDINKAIYNYKKSLNLLEEKKISERVKALENLNKIK